MKLKTSALKLPYLPVKAGLLGMLVSALLMAILLVLDGSGLIPQLASFDKLSNELTSIKTPAVPTLPIPAPAVVEAKPSPVDLSKLKELLTANRALLNKAYTERKKGNRLSPEVTNLAQEVSQQLAEIDTLMKSYLASPISSQEQDLAKQFSVNFEKLTNQVVKPTVDLLQLNYVNQANNLANRTQEIQNQIFKDIDAMIDAQAQVQLLELQKKSVPDSAGETTLVNPTKLETQVTKSSTSIPAGTEKNNSPEQKIVIIALGMFLMMGFAGLMLRTLKHRLGTSPEELNKAAAFIASGNLDYRITLASDDQSSVLAAIKAIQSEWKRFMVDTNILNVAINDGKLLGRRDPENHQGVYREFAQELNNTIDLALQKGQVSESSQRTLKQALQKALAEVSAIQLGLNGQDLGKRIAEDSELEEVAALCKMMNLLLAKMENLSHEANERGGEIQKATEDLHQNQIALKKGIEEQVQMIEVSSAKMQGLGHITKQNAENAKQARLLAISSAEMATTISGELMQSGLPAEQIASMNQVVSKIASSNQYIADMSASITIASLDQSLDLYEANNSVSQVEKIAQKNAQTIADTIQSSAALVEQAQALAKSFKLKAGSRPTQAAQEVNPPPKVNTEEQVTLTEEEAEKNPDWKLF